MFLFTAKGECKNTSADNKSKSTGMVDWASVLPRHRQMEMDRWHSIKYYPDVSTSLIKKCFIQSTLVISTSVISNNRLSRRENLIPVLT